MLIIVTGVIFYISQQKFNPEQGLNEFIQRDLMSPLGGIYTNYIPSSDQKEWASGHEVLSESMGLYMLAAFYDGNQKAFSESDQYIEAYMKLADGGYSWRIIEASHEDQSTNATIDDLRIGKAYYLAAHEWHNKTYLKKAQEISSHLLDRAIAGEVLLNYSDGDEFVDLSYLDIGTMSQFEELDQGWRPVKRQSIGLISDGYLGDQFPFYHKVYNIKTHSFVVEDSINMIDALLVVLHLSEEKRVRQATINWLYGQLEEDRVYGNYRYGDWMPVDYKESTAVYGLIMRIALNLDDARLYKLAKEKVAPLQVLNQDSPVHGAFAYEEALEVYSFDQLQMLVAYRRGGV
jgi:hypothetical protein